MGVSAWGGRTISGLESGAAAVPPIPAPACSPPAPFPSSLAQDGCLAAMSQGDAPGVSGEEDRETATGGGEDAALGPPASCDRGRGCR